MPDDRHDHGSSARDEDEGLTGPADSDDTTQSDAGMVGGTGTDEGGATVSPVSTEPLDEDEPRDEE